MLGIILKLANAVATTGIISLFKPNFKLKEIKKIINITISNSYRYLG